jgi:hypothetical protein
MSEGSKSSLKEFKHALFCIDADQHIDIRGYDEINSVALNIEYIACQNNSTACQ